MNNSGYGYENMVAEKQIDYKTLSRSLQRFYARKTSFGEKKHKAVRTSRLDRGSLPEGEFRNFTNQVERKET
mgnify:CR=1 FL=1